MLKIIEKAPFFTNKLAKNKLKKATLASCKTKITVEFIEQVRQKAANK